jgi:hypothetical protein
MQKYLQRKKTVKEDMPSGAEKLTPFSRLGRRGQISATLAHTGRVNGLRLWSTAKLLHITAKNKRKKKKKQRRKVEEEVKHARVHQKQ